MKKTFVIQKISLSRSLDRIVTYNFENCIPLNAPIAIIDEDIIKIINDKFKTKNLKFTLEWDEEDEI